MTPIVSQVLWNAPRAWPVAVAAGVLLLAAVVWLYPPQVRELRGPSRWGLPILRGFALLALAASVLKPSVLRPKTADERAAVVVLVDRSRSMSVADNARTPAQLVALAAGLGRLPQGARNGEAAALVSDIARLGTLADAAARARGDLEYARVSGRGVEAARRRAEDAASELSAAASNLAGRADTVGDANVKSRLAVLRDAAAPGDDPTSSRRLSQLRPKLAEALTAAEQAQASADERLHRSDEAVRSECDMLSTMSRLGLVEQALLRGETCLTKVIGRQAVVAGFAAAEGLTPLSLGVHPGADGTLSVEPAGRASDVTGAVREALDRTAGREVAAVVFFTDGRQVGGEGAVTAGLSASGVPIFPVAVAPANAARDVCIGNVSSPASAFAGETVTVRAEVRPAGISEFSTELHVKAGDAQVTKAVASRDGKPAAVEFQIKLDRAGAQPIVLAVKPVTGETTVENNEIRRWVKVLSQKVKVVAVASSPTWDFQYLRNALSRTAWVDLQATVLRPDGARLPLSPAQILQQDVLILSDVPAAALEPSQWDAVYRLVSEQGGSVILVAGESHLPSEYTQRLVTANLLPYPPEIAPTWRMWPGVQPLFRFAPHPEAPDRDFLRFNDGASGDARDLRRWQALPGVYRFLPIGRLKPTATPLLIEVASGAPVLTEMRVGAGRSFLFGANETWRWRFKSGEQDHDRFWLQLVRYAAGEPYAVRSARLALDVDDVAIEEGQTVRVRARTLQDVTTTTGGGQRYRVEVTRGGTEVVQSVDLKPASTPDAGRLEARVGPLREGEYELRVIDVPNAGGTTQPAAPGGVSLPLHVGSSYEAELADVSPDHALLRRLADASGGEFFTLERVDRLADRLRLASERRPRFVEQRLWDSPYLFVFVAGCLAAEWAARKRVGLA